MKIFDQLSKEALAACRYRRHMMRIDYYTILKGRHRATWRCLHCYKSMAVDTHPDPNGIDIGGEAVALECGD